MATESPRSYGSVDSYIGSLISLVSKSEIRYEGSLYQINTNESTLGLRNVRSFGTEGRKKDGPQIPQSDRIYDYIVFRGSDIKDLQVKSSPPVLSSPLIHNDPAIIQSNYNQAPATTSFPLANSATPPDLGAQMPQTGLPTTPFQSNCSLYQPEGSSSSWGGPSLATPPVPAASTTSSLHWQAHYGPSSTIQSPQQQQENLLQPPQPLLISSSSQQSVPRSSMNPLVPSLLSQSPDLQSALLLPLGSGALSTRPTMLSGQSSSIISEPPASLIPSKFHVQASPASVSQILDPPLVSPLHALESNTISVMPNQAKLVSNPMSISLYNGAPEKFAAATGISSNSPSLVTPGQFLQPGLSITLPSLQPLQIEQKEGEVVPIQSSSLPTPSLLMSTPASVSIPASSESQDPLLPLPSSVPKLSDSAINYGEDFDFEAMNEQFKKEQVWGHLGRSKAKDENYDDPQYTNDLEYPRAEIKPVYQKDDFFDTLSCNSLARHGRPRFSEQRRLDTETFGDFQRYWGGRGGRGYWRGGRLRGGYYGRGYGYVGRGQGGYGTYRGT